MSYQEKVQEYKEYREQEVKEGRKPLDMMSWSNWKLISRKSQEAKIKEV